jgi:hypothetical protein
VIALTDLIPKWTKRVVTAGGGRDPLGLSRVGFLLTDHLLSGIITTTDRARYYSFYCWSLWHMDREESPSNYTSFVEAFRRREAVMAMASYSGNPEISPVGVEVVRNYLQRGNQSGEYDCNFKVLPSNDRGGYGQYYGGSMYELGLTTRDEKWIDHVTEKGTRIAELFHESIKKSAYIKRREFLQDKLSEKTLRELETCVTLDAILSDQAEPEREELIDLFWNRKRSSENDRSTLRRQTLNVLLHVTRQFGKQKAFPSVENGRSLDEYLLYACYYDVLWISNEEVVELTELSGHQFCVELWRQFCLHQFITQALENLLFAVVEEVGTEPAGMSFTSLMSNLSDDEFLSELKVIVGYNCSSPRDLLSVFEVKSIPSQEFCRHSSATYLPTHKLSEHGILEWNAKRSKRSCAIAVALLTVLYAKWRGLMNGSAAMYVDRHAGNELWAGRVLPYLDTWLASTISWNDALAVLVEDLILNQHDRIMYEKRRLDSSWVQRTDGCIKKDQDFRPAWRSSRFLNAVRIMADLNLLDIDQDKEVRISAAGRKLLKEAEK